MRELTPLVETGAFKKVGSPLVEVGSLSLSLMREQDSSDGAANASTDKTRNQTQPTIFSDDGSEGRGDSDIGDESSVSSFNAFEGTLV